VNSSDDATNPAAAEKFSRNVTYITLGFDYYD